MVDRKRIELFPKACKAPVLPLSPTAHIYKDLTPIYSVCQIKTKIGWPWLANIRGFHWTFQMSISSTSVSYTIPRVSCYNSIHQRSNLKIQPYPIWIRFVRVRPTGVYRVPHAVAKPPQDLWHSRSRCSVLSLHLSQTPWRFYGHI